MRRLRAATALLAVVACSCDADPVNLPVEGCGAMWCLTVDTVHDARDVGAAQGVDLRDGRIWVIGDSSTGRIRPFQLSPSGELTGGSTLALTVGGDDFVRHPTGLASRPELGTFLGETVDQTGTLFVVDWDALLSAGTLDGAVLHTVDDDEAVDGSRPELVRLGATWLVATADYDAGGASEVRLLDPATLSTASLTSEPGVVLHRFPAPTFIQSLHWWDSESVLILVQNRKRSDGWRLTFLDLSGSLEDGTARILDTLIVVLPGELEGFHFLDGGTRAVLVTSAPSKNFFTGTLRRIDGDPG